MLLAAGTFALAMVAASPLLHLLYSSRFDPAKRMMAYALFGEFGRVCAQTIALGALPLGGARLWVRIGVVQPLSLAATYAAFTAWGAGTLSLPMAYAAAGAITFAAGLAMMARDGVTLRARDVGLVMACFAALGALLGLAR